ncbi:MAG: hypothetical protein GC203_02385 [Phenylobacterium sp.]|uniref:hypothetical protein n=1 Tax=Phenylobacterium sp. TaxID=1871053 RepID=UPI0025E5E24A|nr:hypothetical protein [Phenylobacterium sp.]MBI1196692.1 hypothetical protein [Phenylobacterium sp.]
METELAKAVAKAQAMALINQRLLSCLYEIVLRDHPRADAKLRAVSEEIVRFAEDTDNEVATANLCHLTDAFLGEVKARVDLQRAPDGSRLR